MTTETRIVKITSIGEAGIPTGEGEGGCSFRVFKTIRLGSP